MNDRRITSDHPLTEPQRRSLDALLNLIVPPEPTLGMPGAGELGLLGPGEDRAGLVEAAAAILPSLLEVESVTGPLQDLPAVQHRETLERIATAAGGLFQPVVMQTLILYYRHERALAGLGLAAGPPFPRGNEIERGDFSLLAPVRARSVLYRE